MRDTSSLRGIGQSRRYLLPAIALLSVLSVASATSIWKEGCRLAELLIKQHEIALWVEGAKLKLKRDGDLLNSSGEVAEADAAQAALGHLEEYAGEQRGHDPIESIDKLDDRHRQPGPSQTAEAHRGQSRRGTTLEMERKEFLSALERYRLFQTAQLDREQRRAERMASAWLLLLLSASSLTLIAMVLYLNLTREQEEGRAAREAQTQADIQEFVYRVSHDLRSPLMAVAGFANLLEKEKGNKLDPDARFYLSRIASNTARLERMLRRVLEFSRCGSTPTACEPFELKLALDAALKSLASEFGAERCQAVVCRPMPAALGDIKKISEVFAILIENALLYVPPERQPQVEVGVEDAGRRWRVYVRDNGTGLSPGEERRVFKPFERLPEARELNPEGVGMGLTIARRIVELHSGEIWLEGRPGFGTIAFFTLPKAGSQSESGKTKAREPARTIMC